MESSLKRKHSSEMESPKRYRLDEDPRKHEMINIGSRKSQFYHYYKLNDTMVNETDGILESFLEYNLHWMVFPADNKNVENEESKTVVHIDDEFPPSRSLFPCVTKVIKTGSRAEMTFISNYSDEDNIFEIGPGTVSEKLPMKKEKRSPNVKFFWSKTENDGYYKIEDEWGDFLYPKILQIKVGSLLTVGKSSKNAQNDFFESGIRYGKLSRLNNVNSTHVGTVKDDSDNKAAITDGNEDQVIAMRLSDWPQEILDGFNDKLKWCSKELKDIPLYFVPKSHPKSKHPKLEWRLSFSLVELEIMLNMPEIHKRALMFCKKINQMLPISLTSFHWKSVLLWKMDEYENDLIKSDDSRLVYKFVKNLVQFMYEKVKERQLMNYLVQGVNLFEKCTEEELGLCEIRLKELMEQKLPHMLNGFIKGIWDDRSSVNEEGSVDVEKALLTSKDIGDLALLEGYLIYLTYYFNLWTPASYWFRYSDSLNKELEFPLVTESCYYFLLSIVRYYPLEITPPITIQSDLTDIFKKAQQNFPILYLHAVSDAVGFISRELAPLLCEGHRHFDDSFYAYPSRLGKLYYTFQSVSDCEIKPSVLNYLADDGEVKVEKVIEDVNNFFRENENHTMKWCGVIVNYLKGSSSVDNSKLNSYLLLKNTTTKYSSLSEILHTPTEFYLRRLRVHFEKMNVCFRKYQYPTDEELDDSFRNDIYATGDYHEILKKFIKAQKEQLRTRKIPDCS